MLMVEKKKEPWIFVLKEGLLPDQYILGMFRPQASELPQIVVEKIMSTFHYVTRWYRQLVSDRLVRNRNNSLAHLLSIEFTKFFSEASGGALEVYVIPSEEFDARCERGEFHQREGTKKEKLREGKALHAALVKHYERIGSDWGNFSWRLLAEQSPGGKRLNTVSAGIEGNRFWWSWNGTTDTEISCIKRRLLRPQVDPFVEGYSASPRAVASAA